MFHPNARYGNPAEFRAYTAGMSIPQIAKVLHRHPRSIHDWLTGRKRVPYWVPELLRLRHENAMHSLRQMGINPRAAVVNIGSKRSEPKFHGQADTSQQLDAQNQGFRRPVEPLSANRPTGTR